MDPKRVYQLLLRHFGKQRWWIPAFAETRFEVIVGAILVQRTTWRNADRAIRNLKRAGLLSPHSLASAKLDLIESLVRPAGFYRQKASRIAEFSRHLVENYEGSLDRFFGRPIEEIREELLSLKGIGPETADVILLYAGNKPILPVSAYARRVFEQLGVKGFSSYEEWQGWFMESLSKSLEVYREFHALFVRLGKTYCKAKPECESCPLLEECKFRR